MRTSNAQMIAAKDDFAGAPLFRKEFRLVQGHGGPVRADLRATAFGIFEAWVNGKPAGEDVLSPGWSSYEWRLKYRSYDVLPLLEETSVIGASIGNGWYRGRLGINGVDNNYGDELGFWAHLDIEYDDGFVQTVTTDDTWLAGPSATLSNDLYDGQLIDARRQDPSWMLPGYQNTKWTTVHTLDLDPSRLVAPLGPSTVRHEVLPPIHIWPRPHGKHLIDFGQNLVGWVRFHVRGSRGDTITIRYAEEIEHGELATRPLRSAKATDAVILSGGDDFFEPTLTFHGFRYIEVEGWPGELSKESLEAVVVHSALERTGTFECSNELINKLHRNVVWGLKGNFLDLPTDCPQRDERLGWTGDIAVFGPTAAYLYDVKDFLGDWLQDLAKEQQAQGGLVPFVVPDIFKFGRLKISLPTSAASTAVWSDAAVWLPWTLWEAYGDKGVLVRQYDSMSSHTRYVEQLLSSNGLWDQGFQFGDWLDPDAPPQKPAAAKADPGVVATICLYRTATLMAKTAELLDHTDDAAHFGKLAARTQQAFAENYLESDGRIASDSTTAYTLAITFDILPDDSARRSAGERLSELVRANNYRISTGFAGTPYITWALSESGFIEDAYKLLLEEQCPSWLYPVTMGATTIWERWDSKLPDGSINPGTMTSFNHYAFGSVADWLHQVVGGISPAAPGYAKVRIAPKPGPGIQYAKSSLKTPNGPISVEWNVADDLMKLSLDLPADLTAEVELPSCPSFTITGGHHEFSTALPAKALSSV
ncbi:alpha-L-rhamnosidase [Arthrobacter sp. cf158]|uniref:alpha-L-rhamnosidase n=1 Tax=Arthrobacter sp. cf158 TaxID=1761744 RepID=UPI00089C9DF7|nr:alpha-L-rhamnosidase [Arthrobacter sp. cf158]SDW90414.1 alpha-L-rhamnosidase [Arthrobacter sp. cf158]